MSNSPNTIEQLSVFLENRSGCLSEVLHILAGGNINILALSLADTSDFGILRLILSDTENARALLKENGFAVGLTKVVALELEDSPGGLDKILNFISSHGINVEYMYGFSRKTKKRATMIFRFDKIDLALAVLQNHDFNIVSREHIRGIFN